MSKDKFLFSFDFPEDIYGYPIKGDFYGNNNNQGKFIETGNGQFISTSPGWHAVISTDIDGDGTYTEQVTLNATGTIRITPLDDGTTLYEHRGHNIIFDPADAGTEEQWIKYAVGNFTYQSAPGNVAVTPLEGTGQITEITDYFLL